MSVESGGCAACGGALPPQARTGRRRRFCRGCAEPAVAAARWREEHADEVAARNAARRVRPSASRRARRAKRVAARRELVWRLRAAGLTGGSIAAVLGVSRSLVNADLAWLRDHRGLPVPRVAVDPAGRVFRR